MGKKETGIEFGNIKLPRMVTNPPIPYGVEKAIAENKRQQEQMELLREQNKHLEELLNLKEKEFEVAKQEAVKAKKSAKRAKIYNIIMLIIALAAWLLPDISKIIEWIGGRFS